MAWRKHKWLAVLLVGVFAYGNGIALAGFAGRILTGPPGSSEDALARTFSRQIAKPAQVSLEVVNTAGAPEVIERMNEAKGLQLAVLQADTMVAFNAASRRGHAAAAARVASLRALAYLGTENIYFLTRAETAMTRLRDIEYARINIGPTGSSLAMSATTIYRLIFGHAIPADQIRTQTIDEAMTRLLTDRSVDVVVVSGNAQSRLFRDMKPGASRFVRILSIDPSQPLSGDLAANYPLATLNVAEYPNLLTSDLTTLSVPRVLVVLERGQRDETGALRALADSWCRLTDVIGFGEPDSKPVDSASTAPSLWRSSGLFVSAIDACKGAAVNELPTCEVDDQAIGICP